MQRSLILAWGIDIPPTSKQQIASTRAFIQHVAGDPRVKKIYGACPESNGNGYTQRTGLVLVCESQHPQEIEQLANLLQVSGFPSTNIIHLVDGEKLMAGLQEAERFAGIAPELVRTGAGEEI